MGGTTQEIAGVFFAGARDYIVEHGGREMLERVAQAAGPEGGPILRECDAHQWYPEDAFRQMLRGFCEVVAEGDADRFEEIIRRSAAKGIRRHVQIITRQTAPRELLSKLPSLWARMRRGPATQRVLPEPNGMLIHYEHFPRISDPVYVPFFRGLVASLLEESSGYVPPIRVLEHGDDHLVLEVRVAEG